MGRISHFETENAALMEQIADLKTENKNLDDRVKHLEASNTERDAQISRLLAKEEKRDDRVFLGQIAFKFIQAVGLRVGLPKMTKLSDFESGPDHKGVVQIRDILGDEFDVAKASEILGLMKENRVDDAHPTCPHRDCDKDVCDFQPKDVDARISSSKAIGGREVDQQLTRSVLSKVVDALDAVLRLDGKTFNLATINPQ